MTPCGFLHSEICGSKFAYNSPQLIAVNHVLHRLPMPRHSPCAHIRFTFRFSIDCSIADSHSAIIMQNVFSGSLQMATCSFYPTSISVYVLQFTNFDVVVSIDFSIEHVVSSFLHYTCYSVFKIPRFLFLSEQISEERGFYLSPQICFEMVGPSGLEPPTSRLSGVRSNRLSYGPFFHLTARFYAVMVEMRGIEPLTPCLQSRCSPS